MSTANRVNAKFVPTIEMDAKSNETKMVLEKGGATITVATNSIQDFRKEFKSVTAKWLKADDALMKTLDFAIEIAKQHQLTRIVAGKACALMLGVPSMTACIKGDADGSKKIKSKWEWLTRKAIPTTSQLANNPSMSYAEISAQLALDEKQRKQDFVSGNVNNADGTGTPSATLEDKLATKDYASFAKILAERVKGEDALVLMAQLLTNLELSAEHQEAIRASLTPTKVNQGAKKPRTTTRKKAVQPELI